MTFALPPYRWVLCVCKHPNRWVAWSSSTLDPQIRCCYCGGMRLEDVVRPLVLYGDPPAGDCRGVALDHIAWRTASASCWTRYGDKARLSLVVVDRVGVRDGL